MKLFRLLGVFLGLYCSCVHAGLYPDTKINHEPATLLTPNHRTLLEVEIVDPARIDKARCYFRIAASLNFLFTPMTRVIGNTYNCALPAVSLTSSSLEYLFVVKNKHSQVIRSQIYVSEIRRQESLPPQQRLVSDNALLKVFDELDTIPKLSNRVNDKNIKLIPVKNEDDLFGLKIDLYNITQVPTAFKAMPGYFGGFSVDDKGNIFPIQGFATDLKPKDLSQSSFFLRVLHEDPLNLTDDSWEGIFYRTDQSWEESITASVVHNGGSIDIDTSRSNSKIAGRFVGDINSSGDMFVYDKHDNEIWTTFFGPARQTRFVLADFVYKAIAGQPQPPLYVIEMDRELPPHFSIAPIMELLL